MKVNITTRRMTRQDITQAVNLIELAMNKDESKWAQNTFDFCFQCEKANIDSAREYYTAWLASELCGLVGLHHYRWGPDLNVWLSWFAVAPACQGQGIGRQLLQYIENVARESGYQQLLIETYSNHEFARARNFYMKCGYLQSGEIQQYIDDETSMLVYHKKL